MAVTITWRIQTESHADNVEKYIDSVNWEVKAEEPTGTKDSDGNDETYKALWEGSTDLDKPDTLVPYATFNKQSTLVDAVKAKIGDERVTFIENELKRQIDIQANPLVTTPPD